MKRIFSYLAACATMFALAACQEKPIEQPVVETPEVEYQDVTFSVAAPSGPQTRTSYGETVTFPTELHVAVYVGKENEHGDKGTYLPEVKQEITPKSNTEWEVTLSLVKNYHYDIVFWAQRDENAPYTIDWAARKITADYSNKVAANDVTRDAFYLRCENYNVIDHQQDGASYKIHLKRPFAQINLGASDYSDLMEHYGFIGKTDSDLKTSIKTASVPSVLHVLSGFADTPIEVEFAPAYTTPEDGSYNLVASDNDIKVTGTDGTGAEITKRYTLVGTNYIFANEHKPENPTVDFTLTFAYNGQSFDLNVPNVPYARNYQTNILGNFFTSNSKFNVVIVPEFNKPDEYVHVWDGYSVSEPVKGTEGYMITTGAELAWVAQQVNTGAKDFAGETVIIAEEIRLAGYPWTPIGTNEYPFKGSIQGPGVQVKSGATPVSISGLKVDHAEGPAGLVGVLDGGYVKNITLVEPDVKGAEYVGAVVGKIFTDGLVDGVSVTRGQVTGNHYVGGLVGYAYGSVKNSVVNGTVVTGTPVKDNEDLDGDKVGGVIGYHAPDADGTEVLLNKVLDVTVAAKRDAGAVAGAANADNVKNNRVEKATIGSKEAPIADNAGIIVGRVLAGTLNPTANTYNHKNITVNGEQAKPAEYIFEVTYEADAVEIPVEGGPFYVKVAGNVAWTVTVPKGVTASPAKGNGPADITFTISANEDTADRSFKVVIATTEDCEVKSYEIILKQKAAAPVEPEFEGGKFWIVADGKYAKPLSSSYGYLKDPDVQGYIDNAFTFSKVDGGFTIQDATGKYYYMNGDYDTFNTSTTLPEEGAVWTVEKSGDDAYKITNVLKQKFIQFDGGYGSFASYAEMKGVIPTLIDASAATIRPVLTLSETAKTVEADVTEYTFTVNANVEWTATPSSGVTLTIEDSNVTMTFDANTAEEARVHTVKVAGEGVEATFTLTQKGVPAPGEPEVEETNEVLSFIDWKFDGASSWSSSYAKHIVNFTSATVEFASANKQSGTITHCPVTKGGDVVVKMSEGKNLTSAKFNLRQWAAKTQTATLYYSTDGGKTWSSEAIAKSSNFSLESSLPEGTNALKLKFSSTSNQIGIESIEISYTE